MWRMDVGDMDDVLEMVVEPGQYSYDKVLVEICNFQ